MFGNPARHLMVRHRVTFVVATGDTRQNRMVALRVIGDVHAQIDFVMREGRRSYLDLIAGAPCTVQLGDMGDCETYAELESEVDPAAHRFFPGNHDHYDCLPIHCLGDFGEVSLGGICFFFVRGAASIDKDKLLATGKRLGRTLWFPQEELNDTQMAVVKEYFSDARPSIMISHDAPTGIARFVCKDCSRDGNYTPSRTSDFLETLLALHRPRLWLFGHYHHDWDYSENGTCFHCVGELSYVDLDADGNIIQPVSVT